MVSLESRLGGVIGDRTAKPLDEAFGIKTVGDLLRHHPRRYVELGALTDLSELVPGQHVTILAEVVSARNHTFARDKRRVRTEVVVTDGTGRLTLTFFQQAWRLSALKPGTRGLFAGEVGLFRQTLQLTHPDFETFESDGEPAEGSRLRRGIVPIYRATRKLPTWKIENCVELCLDALDEVEDPLPPAVRAERGYPSLRDTFEALHRPHSAADWQAAQDRLRFEEAFVVQTVFAQRRHALEGDRALARPGTVDGLRDRFEARLPFELTAGQRQVIDEITADLVRSHPMHRLLQGEVGSGKTIVALLAMLQVVDSGGQAALLAPTEVLASQHHRSITRMLGDLAIAGMLGAAETATRVQLLTGSLGAAARREALLDAASGAAGIVVGTHALIQEHVQFAELGLLVVDEQHRFGVEQRAALVDRHEVKPHVLVMTATPIPRTIAMTVFGDLETSTLSELPAGRQPIQTTVVPAAERPAWLERAWQRVREEVDRGRQAYVVVSRIGDTAESDESTT
ncbi:MAG TPA: ATP-dependent DNA helicase RecG, partial [Cellulomonas sp.]|nr:ATP-dependent DNA helicase RecG [Cellulomonas sp.]